MTYAERPPDADLSRVIACLWTVRGESGPQRVLPDGCVDVIFDLEAGTARVIGAMTAAVISGAGRGDLLGVRFRPGEAAGFLGVPASELTDRALPLEDVLGGAIAARVADDPQPARVVQSWLCDQLIRRPDRRVRAAVALLERGGTVARAAEAVGVGPRQLGRLFAERVGLGPKQLGRVARLQRLVGSLGVERPDWAALAFAHGYADQAHLAREVRSLAGIPATALWRERAVSETFKDGAGPAVTGGGDRRDR